MIIYRIKISLGDGAPYQQWLSAWRCRCCQQHVQLSELCLLQQKNYRALLYTQIKPNGISGKPNAYGFGTFFHDRAAQTYVDNLKVLSLNHRRVWLVSGGDFNQNFGRSPLGWLIPVPLKVVGLNRACLWFTPPDKWMPPVHVSALRLQSLLNASDVWRGIKNRPCSSGQSVSD